MFKLPISKRGKARWEGSRRGAVSNAVLSNTLKGWSAKFHMPFHKTAKTRLCLKAAIGFREEEVWGLNGVEEEHEKRCRQARHLMPAGCGGFA